MKLRRPPVRRSDPLWAGLVAVLLTALVVVVVVTGWRPLGGTDGTLYRATFVTARQVNTDTPVRVRGVQVGQVESVRYDTARRRAEVAFRITEEDVVPRRDAEAALRWRTVLGGRMELALDLGSRSAAPLAGGQIAPSRTRIQTELEDVARSVRGPGQAGIRATLDALPDALAGNDAGRALGALGDLRATVPGVRALRGERPDDLTALVRSGARLTAATARTERQLAALVATGAETLRTTDARREELRRTMVVAPGTLAETRRLTRTLTATLPELDRLVGALRPGARALDPVLGRTVPVLRQLTRTLDAVSPVLRTLEGAVPRLAVAARQGEAILDGLRPTSVRLQQRIVPFLEREDEEVRLPVHQLIGPTLSSVGAMASLIGERGHVVNFPITLGERSQALLPCATFLTDPLVDELIRCQDLDKTLLMLLGAYTPPTPAADAARTRKDAR